MIRVIGCENCTGEIVVTTDVTVTANPDNQTVGIRSAGTAESIGVNTAQYDLNGLCKTKAVSCHCTNVLFGYPTWSFACPAPPPTVSLSGSGSSRSAKVHSSMAGSWTITFTAEVTYRLKNINTGSYLLNENGCYLTVTFPGSGNCRFKATTGNFRIVLVPDDNFFGRSLSSVGVGETGKIKVEPIGTIPPSGIFPLRSFSSSNNASLAAVPNLNAGTATFRAGNLAGSAVVTAVDKNGHAETYSITVVEPSGVRQEKITPTVQGGWEAPDPNDDRNYICRIIAPLRCMLRVI